MDISRVCRPYIICITSAPHCRRLPQQMQHSKTVIVNQGKKQRNIVLISFKQNFQFSFEGHAVTSRSAMCDVCACAIIYQYDTGKLFFFISVKHFQINTFWKEIPWIKILYQKIHSCLSDVNILTRGHETTTNSLLIQSPFSTICMYFFCKSWTLLWTYRYMKLP